MIETYKLLHGIYDGDMSNLVKMHQHCEGKEGIRGHSLKLHQERSKLNVRKENFPMRIISIWNNLPERTVLAPNVNSFKKRLDKVWEAADFVYNYRASIPGRQRALDRARQADHRGHLSLRASIYVLSSSLGQFTWIQCITPDCSACRTVTRVSVEKYNCRGFFSAREDRSPSHNYMSMVRQCQ